MAKTAAFYKEAFDLQEVGKGRSGVYLSDGHINMAILKLRDADLARGRGPFRFSGGQPGEGGGAGLRSGRRTAHGHGPDQPPPIPPTPSPTSRVKVTGPDEQEIDVSDTGWVGGAAGRLAGVLVDDGRRKNTGELFEELVEVMARLRGEGGCPWDREQTHASLKRYALEENLRAPGGHRRGRRRGHPGRAGRRPAAGAVSMPRWPARSNGSPSAM